MLIHFLGFDLIVSIFSPGKKKRVIFRNRKIFTNTRQYNPVKMLREHPLHEQVIIIFVIANH
ncbi:MAG TPA: hypothetical protein DD671_18990 [Balneolaceae bacterium]|nr:hypothetical protein [Balneolaceae bacterium]